MIYTQKEERDSDDDDDELQMYKFMNEYEGFEI